mgnify:FL=1
MSECILASFTKRSFVTSKLAYWIRKTTQTYGFRRKQTSYAMSSLPMAAEGCRRFVLSSKQAYWLQNYASYGSIRKQFSIPDSHY